MNEFGIITLFPEIFPGPLNCSILHKGMMKGYWKLNIIDLKKYAEHVDDTPCGGGDGMIIRADIISQAIDDHINDYDHIIFLVPFGKPWNQSLVQEYFHSYKKILMVCGRYEGIDYRVYDYYNIHYSASFISIGDYIMAGGELPAMVIIESLLRLELLRWTALNQESFMITNNNCQLLEPPQYTRPIEWRSMAVPSVLLEGNHKLQNQWKLQQSIEQTKKYRPDLLIVKEPGDQA